MNPRHNLGSYLRRNLRQHLHRPQGASPLDPAGPLLSTLPNPSPNSLTWRSKREILKPVAASVLVLARLFTAREKKEKKNLSWSVQGYWVLTLGIIASSHPCRFRTSSSPIKSSSFLLVSSVVITKLFCHHRKVLNIGRLSPSPPRSHWTRSQCSSGNDPESLTWLADFSSWHRSHNIRNSDTPLAAPPASHSNTRNTVGCNEL